MNIIYIKFKGIVRFHSESNATVQRKLKFFLCLIVWSHLECHNFSHHVCFQNSNIMSIIFDNASLGIHS
jgi:hypothetical protein